MKTIAQRTACSLMLLAVSAFSAFALDADLQKKIDAKTAVVAGWGEDAILAKAVHDTPPTTGLTQDAWTSLAILDPKVRALQTNAVGAYLKSKKEPWVSEAFVSAPDGSKLGFLAKTSSWSHAGKAKHDKPMKGEHWQGELETDESSGKQQIQVAVPVHSGGTAVASLVVGIDVSKL